MSNIVIKSEKKRLVEVLVYEPMTTDTDQDAMTAEEIETLAHTFLREGNIYKIDHEHNQEATGCYLVENRIVRIPEPGYTVGSWVVMLKIASDQMWAGIQSGEINGVSWMGRAAKVPVLAKVTEIQKAAGTTEMSLSKNCIEHCHPVELEFDGPYVKATKTGEVEGHSHPIERMTACEPVMGHGHRLRFEDEDGA